MKHTNWRPFIMFGLMIGVILFVGLGFLGTLFFRNGDVSAGIAQGGWWPGMWGMGPMWLIFPCFGLVMMLCMMFFFLRMMAGGGGPMSWMMGHGGPMSWMMGHTDDPQSQSQVSGDEPQDTCPSCKSPIQADWKVCPHCGHELS